MGKIGRKNARKVIVAMSGGIDSSVAAALLKRAGFRVKGVFMKVGDSPDFKESEKRAGKVAKKLSIPFSVVDLRKEFKKRIINSFLEECKKGRTPNPCVDCNYQIKFKLLFEKAGASKNDFFATGHYARLVEDSLHQLKLLKGKDKEKDQSYFLWQLNQRQLKHILFPAGNYTKKEVRALAKGFSLPVLDGKESQEICFIPDTINDFLSRHLKSKPGKITDKKGKVLGKHSGLFFYTIGQRKGIGLPGGPYYVLDKDLKKNILVVTKSEKDLLKKELTVKNVNWVSGKEPKFPLKVKARIRYRHKEAPAVIKKSVGKTVKIAFTKAQRAITPGQSVVFYRGQELLGGGIIC